MIGFFTNIEQDTVDNEKFRKVLYTGSYTQLVLMALSPNQSIGEEIHGNDQFFRFEAGNGIVTINDAEYAVGDGDCIVVPAGAKHNVINTSDSESLKLYTLYSPPHHKDGVVHGDKETAESNEEEFTGLTTE